MTSLDRLPLTPFEARVRVAAPVERVWAALVDWPSHDAWIPFTRVRVLTPTGVGVGARFVARTAVGPLGFDDPMEVTDWHEPAGGGAGRGAVRKTGRVVLGRASFLVEPDGDGGSVVRWREEVAVPPVSLTRRLAPLLRFSARLGFTLSLRRFARQVERGDLPRVRDSR